jgi:hypothetical protein
MNELTSPIIFDVFLLASTALASLTPTEKQIASLRTRRPNWNTQFCRRFVLFFNAAWIVMTIIWTGYVVMKLWSLFR